MHCNEFLFLEGKKNEGNDKRKEKRNETKHSKTSNL